MLVRDQKIPCIAASTTKSRTERKLKFTGCPNTPNTKLGFWIGIKPNFRIGQRLTANAKLAGKMATESPAVKLRFHKKVCIGVTMIIRSACDTERQFKYGTNGISTF